MNFADWYTDTVDIWRVQATTTNGLTKNERQQLYTAIPCRMYQSDTKAPSFSTDAGKIDQTMKIACDLSVDIQTGDQLFIHRGAGVGQTQETFSAFAGDPNYYYEPVGAIKLGLAHQEIRLLQQKRIGGGIHAANAP